MIGLSRVCMVLITALLLGCAQKHSVPLSSGIPPSAAAFSLQKSQIDVSFEEKLTPSARAYSLFTVSVDVVNGKTMVPLHSSTLNGRAFLIRALGKVSSGEAEKVFAAAIEASIQQLADNATALLAQWAEEPLLER